MTNKHDFKNSSFLKDCDYDDETQTLTLCFKSGSTHNYHGVTRQTYDEMVDCCNMGKSVGNFYHHWIRGKYKESKV